MQIKCLAIDDEPLALKQIGAYIKKTPFLELVSLCNSALNALEFMTTGKIDLVFVDINMPDLNGMDFVKSLKEKPGIIFTTAYSEYAVEGFKVEAIDYLLKPIGYDDFLKAAIKAKVLSESKEHKSPIVKTSEDHLFVKSEYKIMRINLSEIKFIESMHEYVRIHLTNEKPVMTLISLKTIEDQLPKERFMRVHRSFIVNKEKIKVVERNRIIFDNNIYIPVSDQYKPVFQEFINKNFLI
ncbi:MAG: DNA-binding response regulator [Bacteroidetes bacterium GWE2_41_25]|nr:MAG: DNA-binding response regulator [Bacteroidetes bacterium GWA2_40_15]OFY01670.1 MAG: DNA-binding response regulator [Bacteroidetes bacterium GWE2_41_25]HBH84842.1 DNA-binding response regulator [Bacteroidales bacterium]HBQ82016.1 DNA-binding response regulator [Bacteroidales bacterium]HCU20099.1 DNA-binding response regulator [Bacteroidales bacterium]